LSVLASSLNSLQVGRPKFDSSQRHVFLVPKSVCYQKSRMSRTLHQFRFLFRSKDDLFCCPPPSLLSFKETCTLLLNRAGPVNMNNSIKHSHSCEVACSSASQEIPQNLQNPTDNFHVHQNPAFTPLQSQINPARVFLLYFLKIHFFYRYIYAKFFHVVSFQYVPHAFPISFFFI
jgi:hypothetical protein